MIRVEATDTFTLGRFKEISDSIERAGKSEPGKVFKDDKFECTKELADYLLGGNKYGKPYVKVIEVIPEEVIKEEHNVEIPKKPSKKKKSKK